MRTRSTLGLTPAEIAASVRARTGAAAQTGASGGSSSTAAASITAAVARAGGGTVQSRAAALQRAGTIGVLITGALALARGVASAAGGSTGQWISFILGGPAPATSTTIAPGDLTTLKDWIVTIADTTGPLVASLRTDANPDVVTAARFFVGTEGASSGYLYAMKTAILAAWTAVQTPAAPATPDTPFYPPADPGTGGGQSTSDVGYILPIGAIALAAIYFFMRR